MKGRFLFAACAALTTLSTAAKIRMGAPFADGPDIFLSCEAVPLPVKVRYMGKPRTSGTLYNEAALPLGPFEAAVRIGGK